MLVFVGQFKGEVVLQRGRFNGRIDTRRRITRNELVVDIQVLFELIRNKIMVAGSHERHNIVGAGIIPTLC